jgi:hypothetical protein
MVDRCHSGMIPPISGQSPDRTNAAVDQRVSAGGEAVRRLLTGCNRAAAINNVHNR